MKLSTKAVEDFKAIYRREYGENLSDDEARELAIQLLELVRLLATHPPESPTHPQRTR